jgi:hypothetical protein
MEEQITPPKIVLLRSISNNLELGFGIRRMLHPVINQIGVDTQNEVKEEKRLRYDNSPYGQMIPK